MEPGYICVSLPLGVPKRFVTLVVVVVRAIEKQADMQDLFASRVGVADFPLA
ncbi:hypothetical protein D3C72_871680 [compost metagenome]